MKIQFCMASLMLLVSGCICLGAQESAPATNQYEGQAFAQQAPGSISEPTLKPNPLEALREFEPAADEEYRLGKGDEITVDFAGRPDMQAKLVIGPDGRITLPLAGDIALDGLTRGEAGKAIETALAKYYSNLSAQVTVTKYTANRILVLGDVTNPGMVTFDGTPTLLEALTRSGLETGPDKALKTTQIPERCEIYRGQNQVIWVELKKLMNSGNALADLRLRRDDVVYVPYAAERYVSVLGQVQKPGAVLLTDNSTLASILANAGGFTVQAGNRPHILIVDPSNGTKREVSMKDILNPAKSLEVSLHPGEIVFVQETGFSRFAYVLQAINPIITTASFAALAGGAL